MINCFPHEFKACVPALQENGFDTIETLRLATIDDLKECGLSWDVANQLHHSLHKYSYKYAVGSHIRIVTSNQRGSYAVKVKGFKEEDNSYVVQYDDDNFVANACENMIHGTFFEKGDWVEHKDHHCLGQVKDGGNGAAQVTVFWNGAESTSQIEASQIVHSLEIGQYVFAFPGTMDRNVPVLCELMEVSENKVKIRPGQNDCVITVDRKHVVYPARISPRRLDYVFLIAPRDTIEAWEKKHSTYLRMCGVPYGIMVSENEVLLQSDVSIYPLAAVEDLNGNDLFACQVSRGDWVRVKQDLQLVSRLACACGAGWSNVMSRELGQKGLVIQRVYAEKQPSVAVLFGMVVKVPTEWMVRMSPSNPRAPRTPTDS